MYLICTSFYRYPHFEYSSILSSFAIYLCFSENKKVLKILSGKAIPRERKHKDLVQKHTSYICSNLRLDVILPWLQQFSLINQREACDLSKLSHESNFNAVFDLSLSLPNRHPQWFPAFIASLILSDHVEIASRVDKQLTEGKVFTIGILT